MSGKPGANAGTRDFPRCAACRARISHCQGVHGWWMHSATRREAGPDGHLATPEGVEVRYVEVDL